MSNTDPIPHFLKQVLDQKDIDTLLTNKSNYGPTTNSIKTFTNSLLEYSLNIRYNIGDTIIATRGFFDKIELLAHIRGLEEFLQFMA